MEPDAALASFSRRSLQNLAKEFGIKANLKSEIIKSELISRGWKDRNENDCSANFSGSAGLTSSCEDPMKDSPEDPSSTHSDQTGLGHCEASCVPNPQDPSGPEAAHAFLPPSQGEGSGSRDQFAALMHTEQRAMMRAQRRATLAQAMATPARRALDSSLHIAAAEPCAPRSPPQTMPDRQGQPTVVHQAQQDPVRQLHQEASNTAPPAASAGGATTPDKLRDRFGAPFAFHRFPGERIPGSARRAGPRQPSLSPSRRAWKPIAPSASLDRNGSWSAAPASARSKSARAPSSRNLASSPFVEHRPNVDGDTAPLSQMPAANSSGDHGFASGKLPPRTTDAHEGLAPRSTLPSRDVQPPGTVGVVNRSSQSGRIRTSHAEMPTFPSQPANPCLGNMGGGSSHSGRLTSRAGESSARITPPAPYPSKPKQRPTPPRPGLPTPPRGARHDSHDPSDQEEPELASCKAAVESEILMTIPSVHWGDIAGMTGVKRVLQEAVVLPSMRPDIFTGLRAPTRGVLLFGPPGTGKSLLAKAIATEASSTFFCMSASSLTSRYVGRGEKMVRALFETAERMQPAIIFIDEIDSVLSARSASEHEASRRLKTEFLLRFDGLKDAEDSRVIVIGATNRPGDLDDAVLRRLARRVHVPLPDLSTRLQLLHITLDNQGGQLSAADFQQVAESTRGYSGSDMASLCKEAAMRPIRELSCAQLQTVDLQQLRQMNRDDLLSAMRIVKPSVPQSVLKAFQEWNDEFGSDLKSL